MGKHFLKNSWRFPRRTVLGLAVLLALPSSVGAFSMGEIDIQSSLGEKFSAEIPIRLRQDEIAKGVESTIATADDYQVLELHRDFVLSTVHIQLKGEGRKRNILLNSDAPLQIPFFNLLLKTSVGRGSHYRNYPVFLEIKPMNPSPDPLTVSGLPPQPLKKTAQIKNTPQKSSTSNQTVTYGPIRSGETLIGIAKKIPHQSNTSTLQVMVALWEKNKTKFHKQNMHALPLGALLKLPTQEEISGTSNQEGLRIIREQWSEWKKSSSKPSVSKTIAPSKATKKYDLKLTVIPEEADTGVASLQQLDAISSRLEALSKRLTDNETGRNSLENQFSRMQKRMIALEKKVSQQVSLTKKRDSERNQSQQWQQWIQYGGMGGAVLFLAGILAWMSRRKKQNLLNQDLGDKVEDMSGDTWTSFPDEESTIDSEEPQNQEEQNSAIQEEASSDAMSDSFPASDTEDDDDDVVLDKSEKVGAPNTDSDGYPETMMMAPIKDNTPKFSPNTNSDGYPETLPIEDSASKRSDNTDSDGYTETLPTEDSTPYSDNTDSDGYPETIVMEGANSAAFLGYLPKGLYNQELDKTQEIDIPATMAAHFDINDEASPFDPEAGKSSLMSGLADLEASLDKEQAEEALNGEEVTLDEEEENRLGMDDLESEITSEMGTEVSFEELQKESEESEDSVEALTFAPGLDVEMLADAKRETDSKKDELLETVEFSNVDELQPNPAVNTAVDDVTLDMFEIPEIEMEEEISTQEISQEVSQEESLDIFEIPEIEVEEEISIQEESHDESLVMFEIPEIDSEEPHLENEPLKDIKKKNKKKLKKPKKLNK